MKVRVGHTDAWEKKELSVMEGNHGVLSEDAASELRRMEWGDAVREGGMLSGKGGMLSQNERTDTSGKEEY